jgi:hypothetical protein
MKTIYVEISEVEFNKFGLKSTKFSFSDLLDIISRELTRQRVYESIDLAEKFNLSKLTMSEISKEIKALRKDAKSNH